MSLRNVILLSFLPLLTFAGVLPDLPALPSRSPAPSRSPLPSASASLTPSPSTTPRPSPQATVPSGSIEPGLEQGPSASATPPASIPPITINFPPITAISTPSVSPVSAGTQQAVCERDPTRPRPKLGKSQRRYAVAVLISAAAVGVASVLYSGVYTWMPKTRHSAWRFVSIIIARLLIVGAIKVSAALVASITKASPDDGALDASGAFLTWGTAIFTRLYNEGVIMTMTALGFMHRYSNWDEKLKEFLDKRSVSATRENGVERQYGYALAIHAAEDDIEDDDDVPPDDVKKVSFWTHLFGGRWERKLVLLIATIYFATEIAVLITNLLSLVGSFDKKSDVFFTPDEEEGQCPISADDIRELFIIVFLQCLYALTHQPSLVPLLTICALRPRSRFKRVEKVINRLRWVACLVLLIWVVSLLVLPQLEGILEPFFIAGDISLFWFVMIAPPAYTTTSYIITAAYTCLAALVGVVLIWRIAQSHRRKNSLEEKT